MKKNSIVRKLQRSLLLGRKLRSHCDGYEALDSTSKVPEDVKEGHFAVIAMDGDEQKRFVVPLNYLTNPTFLRLLEQAAEEYGFDHEGALTIPCRPIELERLLADQKGNSRVGFNKWDSYATMVQSC